MKELAQIFLTVLIFEENFHGFQIFFSLLPQKYQETEKMEIKADWCEHIKASVSS